MEFIIIGLLAMSVIPAVMKLTKKTKKPVKEIDTPVFDLRKYEIERSEEERNEWDREFRKTGLEAWSNRYGVDYSTMKGYMDALDDYYSILRTNGFKAPEECSDESETTTVRSAGGSVLHTYKSPCRCVYCTYRVRRNIVKIQHEFVEAKNPKFVSPLEDRSLMKELLESWKDLHTQKE